MMNHGVALQKKEEITVEKRVHELSIIMKKAENGDPKAIALLEQINSLIK